MAKLVITVMCSIGVAAGVLVVASGRSRRGAVIAADAVTFVGRAREGLRQACAGLAAGLVGGVVGLGLGGRLMMRIMGATSPGAAGRRTEAEEIVGEVTTGGSLFFIVFVGSFGVMGSMVYLLLRRWLPSHSLVAGAVLAAIGGGLLARPSALLDPDSPDFAILGPTWLAVLLCVSVIALGGLMIAVLVDAWVPRWPAPALTVRGLAGLIPLVMCAFPPYAGLALLVVVMRAAPARTPRSARGAAMRRLLATAAVVGGAWVTFSGLAIVF